MSDDTIREFVVQLLIHLDILIIPKAIKQHYSSSDVYFVPCMIKDSKPTTFYSLDSQGERTIFLRYSLARHSIPTALAYKIIGGAINAWPLKDESHKPCLYHKAAVLNVSEDNQLRILIDKNQVMLYMTNRTSLLSISPDVVASVQECLTKNLQSSLLFHYNSFGRKIKPTNLSDLYKIEVGIQCGSDVCFKSSPDAMTIDSWRCRNGKEHQTKYLRYWTFNKVRRRLIKRHDVLCWIIDYIIKLVSIDLTFMRQQRC
ncbi:unnamed protein product [Mytilus coruscus]|uniref:Uncharacterized protein n=1 Tax=Mytilus coruscus TaxID=42192 RepID=A0A6J8C729_MYTCO|nr:unnamed protein product [Mytilus coruscus]